MSQPPRAPIVSVLLLAALLGAAGCSRHGDSPRSRSAAAAAAGAPAVLTYEERMGQNTYRHYCRTCHGETGAGDGFNAYNLDPRPRDLSDPAFQKTKSDADLTDAVRRGGAGVGLSALMPPWGHTLSERQIADVVAYLRTLARKKAGR
jgi:mono/diheme cytochrome c family protein